MPSPRKKDSPGRCQSSIVSLLSHPITKSISSGVVGFLSITRTDPIPCSSLARRQAGIAGADEHPANESLPFRSRRLIVVSPSKKNRTSFSAPKESKKGFTIHRRAASQALPITGYESGEWVRKKDQKNKAFPRPTTCSNGESRTRVNNFHRRDRRWSTDDMESIGSPPSNRFHSTRVDRPPNGNKHEAFRSRKVAGYGSMLPEERAIQNGTIRRCVTTFYKRSGPNHGIARQKRTRFADRDAASVAACLCRYQLLWNPPIISGSGNANHGVTIEDNDPVTRLLWYCYGSRWAANRSEPEDRSMIK